MNDCEWLVIHTIYYTMCGKCENENECHNDKINYCNMIKCIEKRMEKT